VAFWTADWKHAKSELDDSGRCAHHRLGIFEILGVRIKSLKEKMVNGVCFRLWKCVFVVGLTALVLFIASPASQAQTATGAITGTVTDPNGLATADATVVVKNTDTAQKPHLPPAAPVFTQRLNCDPGTMKFRSARPDSPQ